MQEVPQNSVETEVPRPSGHLIIQKRVREVLKDMYYQWEVDFFCNGVREERSESAPYIAMRPFYKSSKPGKPKNFVNCVRCGKLCEWTVITEY